MTLLSTMLFYLDVAKLKDVSNFTFNRTIETGQQIVSAELARPAANNIDVGIKVDPSLVNVYNARLGADYTILDSKYYKLSTPANNHSARRYYICPGHY